MWKNKKKKIRHDEDDFLTASELSEKSTGKKKKSKTNNRENSDIREIDLKKVVYAVIILLVSLAIITFCFADTGIIGRYKKNLMINLREICETLGFVSENDVDVQISEVDVWEGIGSTLEQDSKMIPFENASLSEIALGNSGIVVAKSNYLAVFNDNGTTVWDTQTSVIEPILRTEGEYILLAEKGGNRVCLYQDEHLLFSVDSPNEILTAGMSANGDIVLVTKKEFYKNAVLVYNKNGEQVFSWSSGTDTIIHADISASTRRIAVSLINTDERVKSYVMLFDINKSEAYHTVEFTESVVFNVRFIGEVLNLTSDNRLTGIKVNGDVEWDKIYEDSILVLSSSDTDGNKAIISENANLPQLTVYEPNGKKKHTVKLDSLPDYLDIRKNKILYNSERIVVFEHPDKLDRFIASMDIMGLKIIDDNSFLIVYNNSLEFVSE